MSHNTTHLSISLASLHLAPLLHLPVAPAAAAADRRHLNALAWAVDVLPHHQAQCRHSHVCCWWGRGIGRAMRHVQLLWHVQILFPFAL